MARILHRGEPLSSVTVEGLQGLGRMEISLHPGRSLLVGPNGAGKSTLLNAMSFALTFAGRGVRRDDYFIRAHAGASVTLGWENEAIRLQVASRTEQILQHVGPDRRSDPLRPIACWRLLEARHPNPLIGRTGGPGPAVPSAEPEQRSIEGEHHWSRRDPGARYLMALGKLRAALSSRVEPERALAERTLALAGTVLDRRDLPSYLREALQRSGPNSPRPLSCGEYDVVATLFHALLFAAQLQESEDKPDGLVALVDTPDTFLHPAVLPRFLDALDEIFEQPQTIVATHSMKLLAETDPNKVLFQRAGHSKILYLSELDGEHSSAFLTLYGAGLSSSMIDALVSASPRREAYLQACADEIGVPHVERAEGDFQLSGASMLPRGQHFRLLDFGAGEGRLLDSLVRRTVAGEIAPVEYIGLDLALRPELRSRFEDALKRGRILPSSRLLEANVLELTSLAECEIEDVDGIALVDVLHEIPWRDLPHVLARLLAAACIGGAIGFFDVNALPRGERRAVTWSSADLLAIAPNGGSISSARAPLPGNPGRYCGVTWHVDALLPSVESLSDELAQLIESRRPIMLEEACRRLERAYSEKVTAEWGRALRIAQQITQIAHLTLPTVRAPAPTPDRA